MAMQARSKRAFGGMGLTDADIEEVIDVLRDQLLQHRREFERESVRHLVGQASFGTDLLSVLRRAVEADTGLVTRVVNVNRRRLLRDALAATGCEYEMSRISKHATAALGPSGETTVHFFRIPEDMDTERLLGEYRFRGLEPADLFAVLAVNEADPLFIDTHPNAAIWASGNAWHQAVFCRIDGVRAAYLAPVGGKGLHTNIFWYAGVRP